MFDSGISAKSLIEELKNTEVDIALEIPDKTYAEWLNSLQQLLYTEIIKEQKKVAVSEWENNLVDITSIKGEKENTPIFEDIYAVYTDDGTQLIKSTVASGVIFPNTFFRITDKLGFNTRETPKHLTIVYFVRPALITTTSHGNITDANVMIPVEFIDLVKAKLRGEAYKLANEDSIAAKWLSDYNILLETFKAWIAEKAPNFGM